MNTRKTEENRKQKLLKQIEQQRQTLGLLKADWLRITSPVDRGWQSLYRSRSWSGCIVYAEIQTSSSDCLATQSTGSLGRAKIYQAALHVAPIE